MSKLLYILLFFFPMNINGQIQDLEKLSNNKRNKVLVKRAKEIILKYGPEYYRKNTQPIIVLKTLDGMDSINGETDGGRKYYSVYYTYDLKKERLNMDYTASVLIWADTGIAFRVFFGNGFGFFDIDQKEPETQIPYQAMAPMEDSDWEEFREWTFSGEKQFNFLHLNTLSKNDKDSLLVEIAKDIVFNHGYEYYRTFKKPIIKKYSITKNDKEYYNSEIGRLYYSVSFPYNKKKERLKLPEAARVLIWADTGKAFSVIFGNGHTLYNLDTESSTEFVQYESLPPK